MKFKFKIVDSCHFFEGDDCFIQGIYQNGAKSILATNLSRKNAEKIVSAFEILDAISNWWEEGNSPINSDCLIIGEKSIKDTIDSVLNS